MFTTLMLADVVVGDVGIRLAVPGRDRPTPRHSPPYAARSPKNPMPGLDVAGVVEAIGKHVTRFQPGDEVFGMAGLPCEAAHSRLRYAVHGRREYPQCRAVEAWEVCRAW